MYHRTVKNIIPSELEKRREQRRVYTSERASLVLALRELELCHHSATVRKPVGHETVIGGEYHWQ